MQIVRGSNSKYGKDVAQRISESVPRTAQLQALFDTYPNGVRHGGTFLLGSLQGEAGQSLKINIDVNSPWFLSGKDFESGDGIGGITKVLMAGRNWTMKDVADHFHDYMGQDYVAPPENPIKPHLAEVQQPPVEVKQPEQVVPKRVITYDTPYDGEYDYLSGDGEVLCTVRKYYDREETGEIVLDNAGKPKKQFRQFINERAGIPDIRPLYNIPNILSIDTVIWVEGEKCADALNMFGLTATCTLGGAGMLTDRVAEKFDFTPFKDKNVLVWPDNDAAGKKLAAIVENQARLAGALSVTMMKIPADKPDKWDAADAIDEGFDVGRFIKLSQTKIKKAISLLDDSLLISKMFQGRAPEQKFLISDTIPLSVPVVFAAAGDSGKGMMTLDLAMKVASGASMQRSFGGLVSHFGKAIILSAEDDKDEIHRRIERLDPQNNRRHYDHELRILPLPNLGGVFPMMQKIDNTYVMGAEFERIYDQILDMDNLVLLIVDPMASFVHADINADPAAGAAFMGLLAQIATETGATVMVNHHMAKIRDNDPITTPEQARNLIRGTSAIVDGVRCAFSVWQVDEKTARERCKDLNIPYARNTVFDGAVVKSNGPANREIRKFIRNSDTGLLEDRSEDISSLSTSDRFAERKRHVLDLIQLREYQGLALTTSGRNDGIFEIIRTLPPIEVSVAALKGIGETTIKNTVTALLESGQIGKYRKTAGGPLNLLGVTGGPLDTCSYVAHSSGATDQNH
jgi:5S rRNA maturation endonuclease (ribonuclease M5)